MLYAYNTGSGKAQAAGGTLTPAMPRPRSLTPAAVARAALAVIDRDGLEGLSMRTVARELGMGTMSAYRYVSDRQELERLVVDLVLDGVDLDVPNDAPWTRRIALLAEGARSAAAAHPAVIPLLLVHRQSAPSSWRWGEALLGALTEGGFDGPRRVIAFRCLLAYVIGALQAESLGPLAGPGTAELAALPPAEYPLLADTAAHAGGIGPEQEFGQGLAIILAGLSAALS